MDTPSLQILIMVLLVFFSAFFSASETAFSALNRTRLKSMADKGNKRGEATLALSERYDDLLSTLLVGNNIVNIALASIGTVFFVAMMGDNGVSVSTAVITIVVLIFGEITPKSIAKEKPEAFAMLVTPILRMLMFILTPVNWIFGKWKLLISRIFKLESARTLSQDELITLVDEVHQEGGMDEDESDLIKSAIELFDDRSLYDILTPRVKVDGIPKDATSAEIVEILKESNHSRMPVYEETLDHIVGVLHQKDYFHKVIPGECTLEEAMQKPLYVPETAQISTTLKLMQKTHSQMAVVADEYGGTAGIVTMEDILEELVGEIWDEHDEETVNIKAETNGSFIASGDTPLDELEEKLELELETDASTLGGWVMEQTEKVPVPGDHFCWEGWEFTVNKADGRHVIEVEIKTKAE